MEGELTGNDPAAHGPPGEVPPTGNRSFWTTSTELSRPLLFLICFSDFAYSMITNDFTIRPVMKLVSKDLIRLVTNTLPYQTV